MNKYKKLQQDFMAPCNALKSLPMINSTMNDIYFKGWREWDEYKDQEEETPSNVEAIEEETPSNVINYLDAINQLRQERQC